jgi:AcrR family transcriptional regulator
MRRRAEHVDETRLRITEAAMRMHTTVGPSATSIAGVADAAGVTRLTVYRHFPDMETLFATCSAHWFELHPAPDPSTWADIADTEDRIRKGLSAIYAWYEDAGRELYPIHRDLADVPARARAGIVERRHALAESLLGSAPGASDPVRRRRAVARHVVDVGTWHHLRESGLSPAEALEFAIRSVRDAEDLVNRPPGAPPRSAHLATGATAQPSRRTNRAR